MACDRFTDALRSRALGAPLRADAAAHLAICAHCQATLESEERVLATIGQALHDVGTVKPAPEFMSRVRARVEQAPRWNPRAWWKPAAAAAAAVLVAAIVGGRARQDRPAIRPQTTPAPVQRGDGARADQAADHRIGGDRVPLRTEPVRDGLASRETSGGRRRPRSSCRLTSAGPFTGCSIRCEQAGPTWYPRS